MPSTANTFKITLKGEEADGSIRLNDLVDQLNAVKATLNQVDVAVSGQKTPGLYYRVTHITMNSPATFVVEAVVAKDTVPRAHSRRVVTKFKQDLKSVISGKRPKDVNLDLLESYGALVRPMRHHVAQFSMEFDNKAIDVPRNLDVTVEEILGPDQIEQGSIIGSLDVIDVHKQRNLFKVYPLVGPASIKCRFPDSMLGDAVRGINRNVRIFGELHFKKTEKFPHLIKVSKIDILPDRSEAVTLSSLRGIATGKLKGMSSTEYVDKVRDGGW